ncbi:hypothetical protein Ctob_011194, partial [Chrysochromulina tobinii]
MSCPMITGRGRGSRARRSLVQRDLSLEKVTSAGAPCRFLLRRRVNGLLKLGSHGALRKRLVLEHRLALVERARVYVIVESAAVPVRGERGLRARVEKLLLLSANRARVAGLLRSHAGDPRLLLWREEPAFEGVGHPWRGCRRAAGWP